MNGNDFPGPASNPPPVPPNETYPPPRPQGVTLRPPALKPVVSFTILGITVAVFLLQMLSEYLLGQDLPTALGAKINAAILAGQWWRLITPVLLHASIIHIGFNMYALYILGPGLEKQYGHLRFLVLYLLAGFAGNVISFFFSPNPAVGASTAIFGLLGAQAALIVQNRRLFGQRYRPLITNTLMIAAINLLLGLSPGIDNWGHLGGLVGGGLFAFLAGPVWEVEGLYPNLHLVDRRSAGQVVLAAVVVAIFFGVVVFLRTGSPLPGL